MMPAIQRVLKFDYFVSSRCLYGISLFLFLYTMYNNNLDLPIRICFFLFLNREP